MFGMGFMEIMVIAIIAIIFLGPDKLPETMVNIAKFFRSMKTTVANAKESIEQEMHISELKKEALSYKNDLISAGNELDRVTSMANLDDDFDFVHDIAAKDEPLKNTDTPVNKAASTEKEKITFEKKKPEKNKEEEDKA